LTCSRRSKADTRFDAGYRFSHDATLPGSVPPATLAAAQ
jgi:hypothetical protein